MLGNAFGWPHLLLILAVILLVFGAARLPALAKGIGQSMKIFRKEIKSEQVDDATDVESDADVASPQDKAASLVSGTADKP